MASFAHNELTYQSPYRWFVHLDVMLLLCQFIALYLHNQSFVGAIQLPYQIQIELILTGMEQLLLMLMLACMQTTLYRHAHRLHLTKVKHAREGIACLTILPIILSNAYFFPLSLFSQPLGMMPRPWLFVLMLITWAMLGGVLIHTLAKSTLRYPRISLCLIALMLMLFGIQVNSSMTKGMMTTDAPNVIIIGIDSLNPALINATVTPTLFAWINQSVYFSDTISPLARTSPAWNTILTGLYPHHHHVIYNLMPTVHTVSAKSIAWLFQKSGYATVFATDDRRFNTVDKELGFETVVGPKRGVNDALIGSLNDFPLSNLIINFPISRYLFPYNHINRASFVNYYPFSFDHALQQTLNKQAPQRPLFLTVHFTLPHWPYAFASSDPKRVQDEFRVENREPLYREALETVDRQVAQLLAALKQQHRLDNSVIVMLSDHGETLYAAGSRQTNQQNYQGQNPSRFERYLLKHTATTLDKSAGHGSDLLSPQQYHCLLAWQIHRHNQPITTPHRIGQRIGLIDIAPTLMDLLIKTSPYRMDGMSLAAWINDKKTSSPPPQRPFIMESGMLPNQALSKAHARRLAKKYFMVHRDNGFLEIRPEQLPNLNRKKLYGIVEGDWLLALYPTNKGYLPIILQLKSGAWMDALDNDFAKASPANHLLHKLSVFYHYDWPLAPG